MAPEDKGQSRSLSDIVIRAGAVAAALASVAGLVTLLWPDDPPRIAAKFDSVDVQDDVSLAEFSGRQQRASAPALRLRTIQDTAPQPGPTPEPEPDPDPDPQPDPDPEPDPQPDPDPDPGPESRLGSMSEAEAKTELEQVLPAESVPDCDFASSGMLQCADTQALRFADPSDVEDPDGPATAVVSAKNLLKVLRNTRARPVSQGRTEPVGVTVNFQLTLEGLEGKKAEIRWSLYDAGDGHRVPREWLVNRRVAEAEAEAASDRGGGEFWVPLPQQQGPFFIRVVVYDEDGGQLDRVDSEPFK